MVVFMVGVLLRCSYLNHKPLYKYPFCGFFIFTILNFKSMSYETIIYALSHTEIIKDVCNDDELSWGAKGIAMYLYQNKVATLGDLKELSASPEYETEGFIEELLEFEYIEKVKTN